MRCQTTAFQAKGDMKTLAEIVQGTVKTVSASVNYVGSDTFNGFDKLEKASFPNASYIGENAFYNCIRLNEIFAENVTSIGSSAFTYCSKLKEISFPLCTRINDSTFAYCSSLSFISLPNVSFIGANAFNRCLLSGSLNFDNFPKVVNIEDSAFQSCFNLTTLSFSICEHVGNWAFADCSQLSTASFNVCSSIGTYAFWLCSSLTSVFMPACSIISNYTFSGCRSLESAIFSSYLYSIGDHAFDGCTNLNISINFNSNLANVAPYAFANCRSMTFFNLENIKTLGSGAFSGCAFSELELPNCTSIYNHAFCNCYSLIRLSIPRCSFISYSAFSRTQISNLYLPCLKSLAKGAFCDASYLRELYMPILRECLSSTFSSWDNLELSIFYAPNLELNNYNRSQYISMRKMSSFYVPFLTYSYPRVDDNNYLKEIYSPNAYVSFVSRATALENIFAFHNTLGSITDCISVNNVFFHNFSSKTRFQNCPNLENIYLLGSTISTAEIPQTPFLSTPFNDSSYLGHYGSIYVMPSLLSSYQSCLSNYSDRIVAFDHNTEAVVYEKEFLESSITSIPDNKTNAFYIMKSAFQRCSSLSIVSFPKCLYISDYAFQGCESLTDIFLLNIKSIGSQAFYYCSNLSALIISSPHIILNQNTFGECVSLSKVWLNSVTFNNYWTFAYCSSLHTFGIKGEFVYANPNYSLTFYSCKSLKNVYLLGDNPSNVTQLGIPTLSDSSYLGGEYCSIYVKASLLNDWKKLNTSYNYSSRFVGLTDAEIETLMLEN